jgi:hypothetical protein
MNESALDKLQVLIEADYSGLKVQLQKAMSEFTNFLSEVNSGQVNWIKILQGSFTPALIATIASTFALSIEQALQFQQAVQGASLNTQTSFGNTTASMTNGAYAISAATGQSANDVEQALGQVSLVYKNYNDALEVTNGLAEFATTEHLSMGSALTTVLPLLQQWNVSAGDAANIMATLGESTSFGKLSIGDLANMLASAGPQLRSLISLPNAISQLQEASTVPGFTPDAIKNMFDVVVQGASNAQPQINAIFGNMGKDLQTGGFGQALDAINAKIQGWGSSAQIVGQQFGLTASTISENLKSPTQAFSNIDTLAATFLKNLQPLQAWFTENQTSLDKFKEVWATLIADLEVAAVPAFLSAMLKVLDGADTLTKIFNEGANGPTSTAVTTGLSSDMVNAATSNNPFAGFRILADSFTEGINQLIGQFNKSGGSTNNTTINVSGAPGHVASTATSSQLPSAH